VVPGLHADPLVHALALPLPAGPFPVRRRGARQRRRGKAEPEFELVDTGIFDEDRYWSVTVDYAKAGRPTCASSSRREPGPEAASLHLLPTLWFRNTWAWGLPGWDEIPQIHGYDAGTLVAKHRILGRLGAWPARTSPEALVCDNESNAERLWGLTSRSPYPKDGINDYVVNGQPTVNPTGSARRRRCTTQWTFPPAAPASSGCGWPGSGVRPTSGHPKRPRAATTRSTSAVVRPGLPDRKREATSSSPR
jgi:hypothetical protein